MAFWDEEKKGTAMKKGSFDSVMHAAKRAFRPALSAFLAFAMVTGSVPASAYAEMLDEAARAVSLMQTDHTGPAVGEEAGAAADSAADGGVATPDEPEAQFESDDNAGDATAGSGGSEGNFAPSNPDADSAAQGDSSAVDADAAGNADDRGDTSAEPSSATEGPAPAIYAKNDDLTAATLGGEALASIDAARKALEASGASSEDAAAAVEALLGASAPKPKRGAASKASDDTQISDFTASWLTPSDGASSGEPDAAGQITVRPSDDSKQSVRLRVSYALAGQHDYEPGDITITIPGTMFKDREGNSLGSIVLSVPADPATAAGWNYRHIVDGDRDEYVITNTRRLSAATQGFMEFAFTDLTPHELADMQNSDPFKATVEVLTHSNEILSAKSNELVARFDTYAKVTEATKRLNNDPRSVDATADEVAEAHKLYPDEKYFIVVDWYTTCYVEANQPFRLKLTDQVIDNLGNIHGVILDENATNKVDENPSLTIEKDPDYFRGTSVYTRIKVAYPASKFKDGKEYTFENKMSYELTEFDNAQGSDPQQVTTKSDTAVNAWTFYEPRFVEPKGHFNLFKYGNDNKLYGASKDSFSTHHPVTGSASADLSATGTTGNNGYYGLYGTALNALRDGKNAEVSYTLNTVGYMLPWTYKEPADQKPGENPLGQLENYGKTPVTMTTEDKGLRLPEDTLEGAGVQDLEVLKDYEYTSVTFPMKPVIKKAVAINLKPDGSVDFSSFDNGTVDYETDHDPKNIPVIELQIKTKDHGEWHTYATADWTSGDLVLKGADDTPLEGATVELPQTTTAVRTTSTSMCAGLLYFARVNMTLKGTGALHGVAEKSFDDSAAPVVLAYNDATMSAVKDEHGEDEENLLTIDKAGVDKLMGYTTDVRAEMEKSVEVDEMGEDVDTEHRRVKHHYSATVTKKSVITNKEVYEQAIAAGDLLIETDGTFYDLLPKGMTPDLSTIKLRNGDAMHSAFTIENYRNTGRTMLVVRASFTPQTKSYVEDGLTYYMDQLEFSFDAWYGFDDIYDFGQTAHNVIAYQSSNDQVGTIDGYKGEPDDPRGQQHNNLGTEGAFNGEPSDILDAMADLDGDGNGAPNENVLYAGAESTVRPLGQGTTGLQKTVEVNGDGDFGTGVGEGAPDKIVYAGGTYTYRLSTTVEKSTKLKDLVFYDSLENYQPVKGNEEEDVKGEHWRGTIQSVDVSTLERLGCAPQLYYSVEPALELYTINPDNPKEYTEISDNTDLSNSKVWHKTTPEDLSAMSPEDRAKISAIAVDARKGADGREFELKADQSASVLIHMLAPRGESAQEFMEEMAHAYNNVCMASSTSGKDGQWTDRTFVHEDYTKVGLEPYKLNVRKEWDDDGDRDGLRPKELTLQLLANGEPLDGKTLVLSEENKWMGTFDKLDRTDSKGNVIEYTVREIGVGGYESSISFDGRTATWVLENTRDPARISVSGVKTWKGDDSDVRPDHIVVKLLANGKVVRTQTVRPNASGEWSYTFEDLYKFENGQEIEYTVEEDLQGNGSYIPEVDGTNIVNTYHPYGDLVLRKTTEGDTTAASQGKEFTFDFMFLKGGETPIFDEFTYVITSIDGGFEVSSGTVSTNGSIALKGGQQVCIEDLPEGTTYTVTEREHPGFTVEGSATATGEIVPNEVAEAEFHNVYKASGAVSLRARKHVVGHELLPHRFMFELVDEDTGKVVRTASNGKHEDEPGEDNQGNVVDDAEVIFGEIPYTQADDGKTFGYIMRETTEDGNGYTCSKDRYRVKVTPHDQGDGTMTIGVAYFKLGADGDDPEQLPEGIVPVFENVYEAKGSLGLQAFKTLKGGDLTEGQFTFELGEVVLHEGGKKSEYRLLDEAKNAGDGIVEFKPIDYDQTDAGEPRLYAIREKIPADAANGKLKYDKHVALVQVSVADNSDGTLGIETAMENVTCPCFVCGADGVLEDDSDCPMCKSGTITSNSGDLEFVNSYDPMRLDIQKTLEPGSAEGDPNHVFTFELELTNEKGEPVEDLADDFSMDGYYEPVATEGLGGAVVDGDAVSAADKGADGNHAGGSARMTTANSVQGANESEGLKASNPVAALGAWAMNALGSLFAPERAYAAEAKVEPKKHDEGEWWWTFDEATGELVIGGNNISIGSDADATWPWGEQSPSITNKIKSVSFEQGATSGESLKGMFKGLSNVDAIDFENFDTSLATDMAKMFENCGFKSLNLTRLNTSNVKNMSEMFRGCVRLQTLSFGEKIDTSNVTNMSSMFYTCTALDALDLSSFNTSSTTDMQGMFNNCSSLVQVMFGENFTAKNVKSFRGMFQNCKSLKTLDISMFNTRSAVDMSDMFAGCHELVSADLSSFSTEHVSNMARMFSNCAYLETVSFGSSFDTKSVKSFMYMFDGCVRLSKLDVSGFSTGENADLSYMFKDCGKELGDDGSFELNISGFDTSNASKMTGMFAGCSTLRSVDVQGLSTSHVTHMNNMFSGCVSLKSIDVSNFDTRNVVDMSSMFSNCSSLDSIDVSRFCVESVTNMASMFERCVALKELDLTGFNTKSLEKMGKMFSGCRRLETLKLGGFDTKQVIESGYIFEGMNSLKYIYILEPFTFGDDQRNYLPDGHKWIYVDDPGDMPSSGAPSYTSTELAEKFPDTGNGWYTWDTFATFTFNADGGVGSAAPQRADVSKDVTLKVPKFMRFGHKLTGWICGGRTFNDKGDGTITIQSGFAEDQFNKADGKPIEVKAQWVRSDGGVTESDGKYTFKIPAGYVLHLPAVIPSGTSYRVRELTEDGWKLVDVSGQNGLISSENNDTPLAKFVNARAIEGEPQSVRVELLAKKKLDGEWANASDGFAFTMTGYDPATGNEGTWNGVLHDGGTVTFPALEFSEKDLGGGASKKFKYTLKEVPGQDPNIEYDARDVVAQVKITKGEDGKLEQDVAYGYKKPSGTVKPLTFVNKTKTGSLNITKEIAGTGSTVLGQEFSFKVTKDGNPYSGKYEIDGGKFNTVNGIIKLTAGQTATVKSLSAGTRYTVEEVDIPSGWKPVGDHDYAGTVGAGEAIELKFINEYTATGTAQLMAYKDLPGGELGEGKFEFALYKDAGESLLEELDVKANGPVDMNETLPGPDGTEVDNPHYGMAPVFFDEIAYDVPGTYDYTIVERVPDAAVNADDVTWAGATPEQRAAGGFALDGIVYDSAVRHARITVTDTGKGVLETKVQYMDAEDKPLDDAPVFTNKLQQVGLNLKKVVTNDFGESDVHRDDQFAFKVTFENAAGSKLKGQTYTVVNAEGKPGDTHTVPEDDIITLKAGEAAQFRDLPYGVRYAIEEQPKDGWSVNAGASSGDLTGTLTSPNTPIEVTVANTYSATGSVALKACKDYDDKLEDDMFSFSLAEVLEGGKLEVRQTVGNKGEEITFAPITYGLEDVGRTFTYKVFENPGEREDVAYDNTVYTVEVRVTDNDNGTLTCDYTIRDEALREIPHDSIVFTNRRTFQLPFTGGDGLGMAGVAVLALGCAAYLIDRRRKLKA